MAIQQITVHPVRVFGALLLCGALAACGGQGSSADSGVASLSGSPAAQVAANSAYYFRPHAENPPGSSLIFSITNKPSWAAFSLMTGQLSGTPGSSDTGDYPGIQITATDGTSSATLPPFTIHVRPPNTLVASSDSTGSNSGSNAAAGNSGSGSTGSGSTGSSSTGSGSTGSSTSGAGGSANGSGSGGTSGSGSTTDTVSVSWTAPTENTDGSALTNLSGYTILYGNSASAMTQQVRINTVGELAYVLSNLNPGTWYFEIVAINSSGVQSAPSSVVSITI